MCRIDDADCNEFESSREVTARKADRCVECHRTIEPGERYTILVAKFDGDFSASKVCRHCIAAGGWLIRECRGYLVSQIEEELREHWQEDGIHTRELASLIWGIHRQWRKRNGEMMVVPVLDAD